MDDRLDYKLVRDCPKLYRERYANMTSTCMCWGFECGNGWFNLIYELSVQLESLINKLPPGEQEHSVAVQVKEKYGTLRFYMDGTTSEMENLIMEAEEKSGEICEACGQAGILRGTYWVRCLCESCERYDELSRAK